MALINTTGETPDGQPRPIPISGTVFSFKGSVATGANKTTGWFETSNFDALGFVFLSDKSGNYTIEYSEDKTVLFVPMITVSYIGDDIGSRRKGAVDQDATWCKITWYNDSGSSANVSMRVSQKTGLYQPSLETLGAKGAMTRLAQWVKSILHIADSTGDFGDVYRTGNSLNVNVTNQSTPTDVSTLAKDATLTGGSQKTQVTNFPSTQAISATALPLPAGAATSALQNQMIQRPGTSTTTSVTTTASSSSVLALNANRKGATIMCISGTVLINLGATASATVYTVRLIPNAYYEVPFGYTGVISGIGVGSLSVTELV